MFKQEFKYYKSKNSAIDLSNVLNFLYPELVGSKVSRVSCDTTVNTLNYGLNPVSQWEAYEIVNNPGLIYIRNPFTTFGQRYWIVRCLRDYTKKPNRLNLDAHGTLPENEDWWSWCQRAENKIAIDKLRWATLGYHHNWDTKIYSDESKNTFPEDLGKLTKYVAHSLGFDCFNAEAAIINYYHMDSTLSGHTDHSEQYLEAPLFSFSFGQSAIFLLGGQTIDVKPTAMFLHSGDIVVMSKESRLCYHGVPKVLKAPVVTWNNSFVDDINGQVDECKELSNEVIEECKNEKFWKPFDEYLVNSRININVRQVLQ